MHISNYATEVANTSADCCPAAVYTLMAQTLRDAAHAVWNAAVNALAASSGSIGRLRGNQASASIALLAVLLARGVVQLVDAMNAAGPQLLFRSLKSEPGYELMWQPGGGKVYHIDLAKIMLCGDPAQRTQKLQWQFWQVAVLRTLQPVMHSLRVLGAIALPGDEEGDAYADDAELHTAAAAAPAAVGGAAAGPGDAASSRSAVQASAASSSSSSTNKQVKWSHLLQLQQYSPEWAAAVAAFSIQWPRWWTENADDTYSLFLRGTAVVMPTMQQQYDDAVELCRTLVAIAPLPVVCNKPDCENVGGVSEAAAACKACSECRCRYCSVACQRADWKRHKPACKRMAAAGMTCA
jgi:hypothetical protein